MIIEILKNDPRYQICPNSDTEIFILTETVQSNKQKINQEILTQSCISCTISQSLVQS